MKSWEVTIVSTSFQTVTVKAETEKEALQQARLLPVEERGPASVDWELQASPLEDLHV